MIFETDTEQAQLFARLTVSAEMENYVYQITQINICSYWNVESARCTEYVKWSAALEEKYQVVTMKWKELG